MDEKEKSKAYQTELWNVPEGFKQKLKSLWIVSQLTKNTAAKIEKRKLHVLGAGNISLIPLITFFGATSSASVAVPEERDANHPCNTVMACYAKVSIRFV